MKSDKRRYIEIKLDSIANEVAMIKRDLETKDINDPYTINGIEDRISKIITMSSGIQNSIEETNKE